jgi:transposase
MAKPIEADYGTNWLLPPSLEDLVPANHPARFLREFVDALKLGVLGFAQQSAEVGRPPYANSLLLKVWLYGYWNGIRSHRKLERACKEHLSLLWLTGMNVPDHNTLWRFWQANRKAIGQVYRQSIQLALKAELMSLVLVAVDGTKIEAAASGRSGWSKERMEKLQAQLDEVLARAEAEIADNALTEQGQYKLPETLTEQQALHEAVVEGLKELQENGRNHYHPQEPQARRMKCGGLNRFAYNAQAVADEKTGIIVACDVTNEETDVGQLPGMLEQTKENLQSVSPEGKPRIFATAVADTGYGAAADIANAQAAGFDVIAPLPEGRPKEGKPYHSSNFQYDAARDVCICPQGQALPFTRKKDRHGQAVRVYRCGCKTCPVQSLCTGDPRGRMIEISEYHDAVVAMRQKLATEDGRAKLKERARIIEPRFAGIKVRQAFRRWTVAGLDKVKAQWNWVCLTANLQVLFTEWQKGNLKLC